MSFFNKQDQRGRIGLRPDNPRLPVGTPAQVFPYDVTIVDMASGDNHVMALSDEGTVYTLGVGEQGQLGRVEESLAKVNEEYSNTDIFLTPGVVDLKRDKETLRCDRVWAGAFTSFVRTTDGSVYAWGLNNYSQLGFPTRTIDGKPVLAEFNPRIIEKFCPSVEFICGGLNHTLFLDSNGSVYSCGRYHYGPLGHSNITADVQTPRRIEALQDEKIITLSAGNDCSFAVAESGMFEPIDLLLEI